jgi:hypothetical protein
MIKFKWKQGTEDMHFDSEQDLVNYLRKWGADDTDGVTEDGINLDVFNLGVIDVVSDKAYYTKQYFEILEHWERTGNVHSLADFENVIRNLIKYEPS